MMRNLKKTKNITSCAHMSYFGACGCVPFASPASGSSHLCRPQCESLGLAGCCGMASTETLTSPSFFPSVGPSPSILHWTLRKETLRAAGGQPWQTRWLHWAGKLDSSTDLLCSGLKGPRDKGFWKQVNTQTLCKTGALLQNYPSTYQRLCVLNVGGQNVA